MTGNQTTQFLSRVVAWPQQGETAYINIHYKNVPKPPKKGRNPDGTDWYGKPTETLRAITAMVAQMLTQANVRDIYFCTSSQAEIGLINKDPTKQPIKIAQRHATKAVKLKSLFIDIDLNKGKKDKTKGYETPQELITAFAMFLRNTGLPQPTVVVFTGGGYHMYWVLADALEPDEWQGMADALAEATRQEGLRCDAGCTVDRARILRVPGTLNYKYDPPIPVVTKMLLDFDYTNASIADLLEPYKVIRSRAIPAEGMELFPPRQRIEGKSDLEGGVYDTIHLDTLALGCSFIETAITTGGASFSEPMWNMTTLIAVFTEGGLDDAHRMADGYPNYNPDETDAKFAEKQFQKDRHTLAPPYCSTISREWKGCATCPYLAQGKQVVNLASQMARSAQTASLGQNGAVRPTQKGWVTSPSTTLTPATTQVDDDLPFNYRRDQDGTIHMDLVMEDGEIQTHRIFNYRMDRVWLTRDPWTLHFWTEITAGRPEAIAIEQKSIHANEFRGVLQTNGFVVDGGTTEIRQIGNLMNAWISKLQRAGNIVSSVPFGWKTTQGKLDGFVFGGELHTPKGTETATPGNAVLAEWYAPTGDRSHWLGAAQMITAQGRPALDVILASAFAGPLFAFTGHSGTLLAAHSPESGIGKTTAMTVAQAVWGNPSKAMMQLSDTQNSVADKISHLQNLPIYYDELKTSSDMTAFNSLLFQLTSGRDKGRLSANAQQRSVGTWKTMMVSSSNQSFVSYLSNGERGTAAGIYRIFEFLVEPMDPNGPGRLNVADAQSIISGLSSHYGIIGLEYARHLGSDPDKVKDDVLDAYRKISKTLKMGEAERFWAAIMASLYVGAKYAKQLGLARIDLEKMMAFLNSRMLELRDAANQHASNAANTNNSVNTLALYMQAKAYENTLRSNIVYGLPGTIPTGAVAYAGTQNTIKSVHVHIGVHDHKLRIAKEPFMDWLKANGYAISATLNDLKRAYGAKVFFGRMGIGFEAHRSQPMYVIEIDTTNYPDLQ